MHKDEAEELNRNIRTVGYHEWVDIPNGLVYQSCCDCGLSHSIMVALPDADAIPIAEHRVRFILEPELTEATRESEKLDIPLYREVKRLREENMEFKRRINDALDWIKLHSEPHYTGPIEEILHGNRPSCDTASNQRSSTDAT